MTMVCEAGESSLAVRTTRSSMVPPGTRWRTFGRLDFIRVPWPAARTTTWIAVELIEGSHHTQELNPTANSSTTRSFDRILRGLNGRVENTNRESGRLRGFR